MQRALRFEKNSTEPRIADSDIALRSSYSRYRSKADRNETIERSNDESAAAMLRVVTGAVLPGNAAAKSGW